MEEGLSGRHTWFTPKTLVTISALIVCVQRADFVTLAIHKIL